MPLMPERSNDRGCEGWQAARGERDLALELAALPQAGNDPGDQQLPRIGVDMGIEPNAGGHDAGSDVGSVVGCEPCRRF
jgi:hypothetical protein